MYDKAENMLQLNWIEECNLTTCSGSSGCSSEHNMIWQAYMRRPCLVYVVSTAVQTVFLLSFYAEKLWKKSVNRKIASKWKSDALHCRMAYKATLITGLLLSLSHVAVLAWGGISSMKKGWNSFALLELSAFVQMISCFSIVIAVLEVKWEGRLRYSQLLRTWWTFSFLTTTLVVTSKALSCTGFEFDGVMNCIQLPLCLWLAISAMYGRTGISMVGLQDACEPLLPLEPKVEKVTDYATAGLLSRLTFSWLDPLLADGYKKPLKIENVPHLEEHDRSAAMSQVFRINWCRVEGRSLLKCLVLSLWREALVNAGFAGLYTCASYVGPFLINDFVEYLGGRKRFAHEGYILTAVFFVAKIIETLGQRQWFFGAQQLGLRVTSGLSAMIYRKGLSLSNQSRQNQSSGEIINYVSVDVRRLSDFGWYLHDLWLLPLQISLALLILYQNLGIAALTSLGATALAMLVNIPLSTKLEKYQNGIMEAKDARMRATNEVLKSMRILKLQAWEMRFMKKLEDLRSVESGWLRSFLYGQAAVVGVFWSTPALVAVVAFGTCIWIGMPLTAGRVLSALATFRVLQNPIYAIPELVGVLAETRVSVYRIQKFLQEQEIESVPVHNAGATKGDDKMAVNIHNACFSWDSSEDKLSLKVRNLQIPKGSKVAVCGQVGSGKSSLISCILGELPKVSGKIEVNGRRAYVAQSSWIQTGKLQDNILFGKPMDKHKYEQVLSACSLKKDLELFSHGDQTEIGERGINLSGGQKQRIQIARALYEDADIYLLDDPFSAVDAHTGSHLFQRCILEMLDRKTVVYVTHQVEFLPLADQILVLEDGDIIQSGRFDDLLKSSPSFSKLIGAHAKAIESVESSQSTTEVEGKTEMHVKDKKDGDYRMKNDVENADKIRDFSTMKQLVQEEERETGQVSMYVYSSLVTAVHGGALLPCLLLSQFFFQLFQIASSYWMAWATPVSLDGKLKVSNKCLLEVFIALAAASAVSVVIRAFLLSTLALRTAQKFFIKLLHSIFHAPMSFFDATPAGRILSRMSTDQSALDLEVYNRFAGLAFNIIQLIGVIAVMSQVAWLVFALFIPMLAISLWLQRYYITSARELARLVGIRRSPIIHHLGESISGVATIRAFGQQLRFMKTNLQLIDDYCKPLFHSFGAMEWLCFRLNMLSSIVFVCLLLFVVSLPVGTIDAGIAGLAVTYGLNIAYLQYCIIWNLCNLENKIISVERIQQYTNIESEKALVLENSRPANAWPWQGTIVLENLQIRYAPHMPLILKGITCTFLGGHKIGVVGRTGSGKSTLIQALFRIVEPVGGRVLIDDVDISGIGLHDLRSKLSIIPQDPTLFEGTIRTNLDPLQEYTDQEIWRALDKSQLGDVVRAKDEKLDAPVTENGENWSVGQRQLVCLGRALLKRTRILVLDEATASVDTATDGVIQDTIRSEFTDCTVITIAHRIPTVIDSDRVLFLSGGRVAEYDSPRRLLENGSSLFSKLVSEYTQRSSSSNVQR